MGKRGIVGAGEEGVCCEMKADSAATADKERVEEVFGERKVGVVEGLLIRCLVSGRSYIAVSMQ